LKRVGLKELLEIAYSIEKNGKTLFLKFAQKFKKDKDIADLFTKLAHDEDDHLKHLKEFEKKYYTEGHLFELLYDYKVVKEYFHQFSETNLMKDFKANLKLSQGLKTPLEAIKIGLNLEMDSILFYEKFKEINKHDPDVDKLLKELVDFETGHVGGLYQYLRHFTAKQLTQDKK